MKVYIDTTKLTDAPFDEKSTYPFSFDDLLIDEIVQDIKCGTPTCYLVSGYRGAGKSSFVKKVESIACKNNDSILFVHINFTRYKSQDYLLRKLIRAIYQSLVDVKNKTVYENLLKKEKEIKTEEKTDTLLKRLYDQTFEELTNIQQTVDEKAKVKSIEFDYLLFGVFLLTGFVSVCNFFKVLQITDKSLSIFTFGASVIGALTEAFSIKSRKERKKVFTEDFQRKSMYDNEISDFHFNTLLDKFYRNNIKLVFVLDELDKVKPEEVDPLVNEMKPYLVSGKSSFIVVAGQSLFYKYKSAQTEDDAVISTLFSRIIHVPLPSIDSFRNIFDGLINKSKRDNPPSSDYQLFIDSLIFESKRIPRRFVNLIREKVAWNDGGCIAFEKDDPEHKLTSAIINSITKVDNDEIAVNFDSGARDYVIMQLFLKAELMLSKRLGNQTFTLSDLFKKEQESKPETK
jgi:hypothetical protein